MKFMGEDFLLFCSIMDFGKGSKLLKISKELKTIGGTIFLGRGTLKSEWLNKLGIFDTRKEIFLTMVDKNLEDSLYQIMEDKFGLDKAGKGIAFSMPIKYFITAGKARYESKSEKEDVKGMNYESIFVIVDKGLSEDVIEAAESADFKGGTVIHGRGSGTQEKAKLFNIEIEPEKDIVLILSKAESTERIVNAIEEKMNIDVPGSGIIFVMDVSRTLGLFDGH